MRQPSEPDGYSASDHLRAMHEHTSPDLVDMVVLSSSRIFSAARRRYADYEAQRSRTIATRLARLLVRLAGQFAEPLGK